MLALEAATGLRHEYQDGVAVAMAGGSVAHARLQGTVRDALKRLADPRGCEVFPADLRLWIPQVERATFADASVFCEPRFGTLEVDALYAGWRAP
ncbi:MAG: Uma2 family endonuclease [Alphaproteobacteria bacterium]|nr:Uma2 family endonuclease [Alphaproteobacteria bacterium]